MKILYIISSLNVGGAEILLLRTTNILALKHKIIVVYLKGEGDLAGKFRSEVKIVKAGWKVTGLVTTLKEIHSFKPDIVHSHLPPADLFLLFLRPFIKCRTFTTIHNIGKGQKARDFFAGLVFKGLEIAYGGRHKFLCISKAVADYACKRGHLNRSRIVVLFNGVTIPEKVGARLHSQDVKLLFVGRLVVQKNPFMALEIAKYLLKSDIPALLTFVGDGPLWPDLEQRSRDLEISNRINFVGKRFEVEEFYKKNDFLLITSNIEGFGLVAVEGMASGLCVLARPVGGLTEIISHGDDGFLCLEIDDFVETIRVLHQDRKRMAEVAASGRIKVQQKFSLDGNVKEMLALYEA